MHSSVIIAILLVDFCYSIITSLLLASLSVQYILMSIDVFELCHSWGLNIWICQFGLMIAVYAKVWLVWCYMQRDAVCLSACFMDRFVCWILQLTGLFYFLYMITFVYEICVKSLSFIKLQWWWWSVNIMNQIYLWHSAKRTNTKVGAYKCTSSLSDKHI